MVPKSGCISKDLRKAIVGITVLKFCPYFNFTLLYEATTSRSFQSTKNTLVVYFTYLYTRFRL